MSNVTYNSGNWRITITGQPGQLWMMMFYLDRLHKVKKFPTVESALRWALDVKRAVDAGIESDPV